MYEDIPRLIGWESKPIELEPRSVWERQFDRRVRTGEKPKAILAWEIKRKRYIPPGETFGDESPTVTRVIEVPLYDVDQTRKFVPSPRTLAIREMGRIFLGGSSKDYHLWLVEGEWTSCLGPLRFDRFEAHLSQLQIYGIRSGGQFTNFGGIDLDLHNGDPAVFLEQLQALLDEFHGRDGWHFQVADQDAGGVHFLQVLRSRQQYREYLESLRAKLLALDAKYPDLARRADAAGMRPLGQLEIFPNCRAGLRLPFCSGRTILTDGPLANIIRRNKSVVDVEKYISWVKNPQKYMPTNEVVEFIRTRLRKNTATISANIRKLKSENTPNISEPGINTSSTPKRTESLKNKFALNIQKFWGGKNNPPDSLNQAILLLANISPYFFQTQESAVSAIEKLIDELPNISFSDRLSSGNRAAVCSVVKNNVSSAFRAYCYPTAKDIASRKLLDATIRKWSQAGFNPFEKSTWTNTAGNMTLGPDFDWTNAELQKMEEIRVLLKTDISTTADFVKCLLRLIAGHDGEIAISLIQKMMTKAGIKVGSNRERKANNLMRKLADWNWIVVLEKERWHPRQSDKTQSAGLARRYGIGKQMQGRCSACSITSKEKENSEYLLLRHHFAYEQLSESELQEMKAELRRITSRLSDI